MTPVPRFVLASGSPARLRLLRQVGIEPEVVVSGIDESTVTGPPADVALTLAVRKATAIAAGLSDALVLGCDSVLDLDGEALGKPANASDAVARWRRMRGRSGVLHTGHCLVDTRSGRQTADVASTVVHFGDLSDDEIESYVGTGEPLRVAGAFTIDGLGGPFVERIEGDPHTVIGLSLPLLRRLLGDLGWRISDLWTRPAG
ncbi:MAG: septum formation inhibitor Maf [Sporichthyaceae bacterium]|nr:septum formation inhibitor Maf [Sporichthyaceae bacterium]